MQNNFDEIIWIISQFPSGITVESLLALISEPPSKRSLQRWLKTMMDDGRISKTGTGRSTKYVAKGLVMDPPSKGMTQYDRIIPLSKESRSILTAIRQPKPSRSSVSFSPEMIADYEPHKSAYLSNPLRKRLKKKAETGFESLPPGTFGRSIRARLLSDLAWSSSRLKACTYSRLDAQRLIEKGQMVEGKSQTDAQMILNHQQAIEWMLDESEYIGFNRYTFLNLHGILSENLVADPTTSGRLRFRDMAAPHAAYQPTNVPQLIEVMFDVMLSKTDEIEDPFEQSIFILAQMAYLLPFEDGNLRVARLAADIPFIKHNMCPLTYTDVPRKAMTEAVVAIQEKGSIALLRDIFIYAYERSTEKYIQAKQSLPSPDPIRLKYRTQLHELLRYVVFKLETTPNTAICEYANDRIDAADRKAFIETATDDLTLLHEGTIARYRISPDLFDKWKQSGVSS